jgi:hypothetical protein
MFKPLPVKLTDEELRAKGDEIANQVIELIENEDDKKNCAADYTRRIKAIRQKIAALSGEVSSGTELRDVRCEERPDYEANLMLTFRLDTGEIIERRVLTHDERQQKMVLVQMPQAAEEEEQAS